MKFSASFITSLVLLTPTDGFVPAANRRQNSAAPSALPLAVALTPPHDTIDYRLDREEIHPILRIGNGEKEKIVNGFGLWCAVVSLFTGFIWMAAMMLVNAVNNVFEDWDPHRAIYDTTGKIWAKTWLTMTNSFPTISGDVDRIGAHEVCLYVANHASWLDIPVLCTVLDPVFKFIAKGELQKVPCIGQQLIGGHHILIDREDRRSQLRTFKEGLAWLNQGVPIMAFPEGMRSPDGRLMEFKKGIFSLAVKAGVPIVPITLTNTHAVMPSFSYFPVQPGAGKINVHVGEAIDAKGKSETELEELVRQAFVAELPASQQPLTAAVEVAKVSA